MRWLGISFSSFLPDAEEFVRFGDNTGYSGRECFSFQNTAGVTGEQNNRNIRHRLLQRLRSLNAVVLLRWAFRDAPPIPVWLPPKGASAPALVFTESRPKC